MELSILVATIKQKSEASSREEAGARPSIFDRSPLSLASSTPRSSAKLRLSLTVFLVHGFPERLCRFMYTSLFCFISLMNSSRFLAASSLVRLGNTLLLEVLSSVSI